MRQIYLQKNHGWRDAYNPLRGLNLSRLVALQEAGERGQYADLQWLYYYMERSDAMIHSVIQRRRAALLSLDWDIRIVSQAQDNPLAEEQADFLRLVYDNIGNFREAVSFPGSGTDGALRLAEFRIKKMRFPILLSHPGLFLP